MEILSRQTYIETGKSIPRLFMTAKQLSEYEGLTEGYYRKIFSEVSEQIVSGRYPEAALTDSAPRSINYYVYRDYMTNRKRLKDRTLKKYVPDFNPGEIARICPMLREVIVMEEGNDE